MEDHELISQLPVRERLFLYAKGARAMATPTAVFSFGISMAWSWGGLHWFSNGYFSKWSWGWTVPLMGMFVICAALAVIMLGYGGGFGVAPTFNIRYFGLRHVGANYGALLTAWGVAGVVGPVAAAMIKDATGSYMAAMPLAAVVLIASMALPVAMGKPRAPVGRRSAWALPVMAGDAAGGGGPAA